MYKTLSAPQIVQIELSSLCPNNCQHCYNFWRNKGDNKGCSLEGSPNMSINQIEAIMDQLIEYRIFHIILTGGEPLLNKNVLFRAIEKAKENGITTSINSTLTTLNDRDCAKLKELEVSIVMTSILGPNPGIHDQLVEKHGAFQQTVEGINLLQNFNVPVTINMVITKKNKMYISETMRLAKELGLKSFNCTRAGCPGNCQNFDEYSLEGGYFIKIGARYSSNISLDSKIFGPLLFQKSLLLLNSASDFLNNSKVFSKKSTKFSLTSNSFLKNSTKLISSSPVFTLISRIFGFPKISFLPKSTLRGA